MYNLIESLSLQLVSNPDALTEEEKTLKDVAKHAKNFAGLKLEQTLFQKLQSALGKVRDIIAISGWEVYGPDDKKVGEFDFLIISLQLRAVVHIEVKRQLDERSLDMAFQQLTKAENLLRRSVPFPASESWQHHKFVYLENITENELAKICFRCQEQLILRDTNIGEWWTRVQQSALESNSSLPRASTYLGIVKFVFYHMLAQENVITKGSFLNFIRKLFCHKFICVKPLIC